MCVYLPCLDAWQSLARRHSTLQEVSLRGDVCCQADHSLICLNTLFDAPPDNLRVLELSNGQLPSSPRTCHVLTHVQW